MRGSRVQSVVNELQGEKIDIVHWSEDPATLVVSALAPAEIQKVIIDDQNRRIEVILTEENLSKAIGRRGQNVRLASKLIDFEIDILTEKEESEKRQLEFKDKTEIFLYLNPEDLVLMRQYRPKLLEQIEGIGQLHFLSDENLILGECRLENKSNLIDSTWREKLSNAAEAIWKLYHTAEANEIEPV